MTYIKSIAEKYPPFKTAEEEQAMIKSYLDKNDEKGMKDELVLRNVGLIPTYGKCWLGLYTYDEMVSYGIEGLIRAARSFNPNKGYRFSTYAGKAIRTWLQRNKKEIRNKMDERTVSYDQLIEEDDSDSSALSNILDAKIPEELRVIKSTEKTLGKDDVYTLIDKIAEVGEWKGRLKEIVCDKYINDMTPTEIGKKYNISRTRVDQIINRALFKFRRNMGDCGKMFGLKKPTFDDFKNVVEIDKQVIENGKLVQKKEKIYGGYDWNKYTVAINDYNAECHKRLYDLFKYTVCK